jgi:hypothetical protein
MHWLLLTLAAHAAPELTPSPAELQVVAALSVRHDPPSCTRLGELLPDPGASFARIAEGISSPPWVGPRAALCLMNHPKPARAAATRWLADPELAGLADVALQHLGALPEPDALALARLSLIGPHATLARTRLRHAAAPLRALVEAP